MEQKTAMRLAGAFLDLLGNVNVSISDLAEAMLGAHIPTKYKNLVRHSSTVGLAQMLRSQPEPSHEEVADVLARFEILKKTPQLMRPVFKKAMKELPRSKSGPRERLNADQKARACAEIMLLRV